jgi:hypothetical protein
MKATTTESHAKIPFSFEERVLISSPSTGALKSPSSTSTTKTVRLESLAQWKDDAWIHPFSDIDLIFLSGSNNDYNNRIVRVQMSISSHGTQRFPTNSSNDLDHVPVLPLWQNDHNEGENSSVTSNVHDNERYLSIPQGFFLSIRPVHGLTLEEEARAVQDVFQELIRKRLLTTPVTGGKWDVVEDDNKDYMVVGRNNLSSPRLYQLILPFDGAAWSSDALEQSFRRTLPKVCGNVGDDENSNYGNDRFFGWSGLEWSNFLVGYKGGGGELGRGDKQSLQHLTYNKMMWWTWTSSSWGNNKGNSNEQSLSFGIQYQTTIPSNAKDWLPNNFLDEASKCPVGKRNAFEVLPLTTTNNTANSYQLVPLAGNNGKVASEENENLPGPKFSYSVGIEQVLRRHHTNQGRFESSIDLNPLFDLDSGSSISCRMTYRQLLPDFLTPMWRSLRIVNGDNDGAVTVGDAFYSDSDQLQASVEWNAEDQSSILTVEAVSGQNNAESTSSFSSSSLSTLPSTVFISLEYTPSFLTIDDFPGDPNRGRVLPPARVTVRCDPSTAPEGDSTKTIVYSNSLLLLPPVPDLSMPFNVISLTSSIYAYIIGAMVTILVRKGSERIKYKMHPDRRPKSKLTKLKTKLREKIGLVKAKLLGKEDTNAKQKDAPLESTTSSDTRSESSDTGKETAGETAKDKAS